MAELEMFDEYLRCELCRSPHTLRAYIADVSLFADWLTGGNRREFQPLSVTSGDIRSWLGYLSRCGEEASSVRRRMQSLRCFFRFLSRKRMISINPASDIPPIKLPKRLPEFVKAEEVERILLPETSTAEYDKEDTQPPVSVIPEHLRDTLIIEILYATGMRRAELLAINDDDIDWHKKEVKVLGKGRKQRIIPLADKLLQRIKEWQEIRDSLYDHKEQPSPLLATSKGRMSATTLYRIVRNGLSGVKSGKKSPHTLRHTFATAMLNDGAALEDVKDFLGHSSLATTQIYTHVSFADMMKAYDAAHPRADRNHNRDEKGES